MKDYFDTLIKYNLDLSKKLRKENNVTGSSIEAYSFIIGSLKILHEGITNNSIKESITDDKHDGQIDAIVIEDNEITVYDFKKSAGFKGSEVRLFVQSVDKIIFNPSADLSAYNDLIKRRATQASNLIDKKNYKVRLRVVRTGNDISNNHPSEEIEKIDYASIIEKRLITGKALLQHELKLDRAPLSHEWNVRIKRNNPNNPNTSSLIKIKEDKKIKSLICRIALKELVDLYHEFQPNPERIFESNVRGLQNAKKIPIQILDSLSTLKKARNFYKLHNGIAIVGDSIIQNSTEKFIISNPQIVNGCQTVTTISEHYKQNRTAKELETGSVLCKVFAANKDEVESICFASNSQNSIAPADLRTNDDIQLIIESFLNKNGIDYNRKAVRTSKKSKLIFTELGQWLCSCILFKPAFAKNSKSKIFESNGDNTSIYDQLFNDKASLNEIERIVTLGLFLKNKNKTIKNKSYQKPADLHFLAGMYHVLSGKNWSKDYVYKKVNVQMRDVIAEMKKKHGPDLSFPSIFTKYDDTWILLKARLDKEVLKL